MTRMTLTLLVALACAVQGCTPVVAAAARPRPSQVVSNPVGVTAAAAAATTQVSPAPTAAVAPKPTSPPAVVAAAVVPSAPDLLLKPLTPVRTLSGTLELDPHYAVASGGGTVVSHNGSALLAMGQLVFDAAGRLVSSTGGALVAGGGGNVVSHNGSAAIANNDASLISAGGGNAVVRSYRLADASATATAIPASGLVPAAGMVIEALGLGDDSPLPLGVDAAGAPVYAVYSNALGRFEIYLPADATTNIHLRAQAPGTNLKLQYDAVATPGHDQDLTVDEDMALVSRYLLGAFRGKLVAILQAPDLDDPTFLAGLFAGTLATPALRSFVQDTAHAFKDRVVAAHVPASGYPDVALRGAAALLGDVDLDKVLVDVVNTHWDGSANEPALDAMRAVFAVVRGDVTQVLAEDPGFFAKQDYVTQANQALAPGMPVFAIEKASDLGDLLVGTYFSSLDPQRMLAAVPVLVSVAPPERKATAYKEADHLFAATSGIALALAAAFVSDDEARAAVFKVIDAAGTAPPPAP